MNQPVSPQQLANRRVALAPAVSTDCQLLLNDITRRQLECLAWVQEGKSASDIGIILGLSGRTVEKHLVKLCGHLGVKTRVQAVVRARELGLLGNSQT